MASTRSAVLKVLSSNKMGCDSLSLSFQHATTEGQDRPVSWQLMTPPMTQTRTANAYWRISWKNCLAMHLRAMVLRTIPKTRTSPSQPGISLRTCVTLTFRLTCPKKRKTL